MKVNITDGGRSQYFKGIAGDCVTRAVALVTGRDYKEVYDEIKKLIKRSPRDGVAKQARIPTARVEWSASLKRRKNECLKVWILISPIWSRVCLINSSVSTWKK